MDYGDLDRLDPSDECGVDFLSLGKLSKLGVDVKCE